MFYVSDIKTVGKFKLANVTDKKDGVGNYRIKPKGEYKLIGVTDTEDGVTDYYSEDVLLNLLNGRKFYCEIYGILPFADELWLNVLTLNKDITANELKHRILNWRKTLSPESRLLVKYYLLEAKIETAITIAVDKVGDNGQRFKYGVRYVKVDEDTWEYNNTLFTSEGLADFLMGSGVVAFSVGYDDYFEKVVF